MGSPSAPPLEAAQPGIAAENRRRSPRYARLPLALAAECLYVGQISPATRTNWTGESGSTHHLPRRSLDTDTNLVCSSHMIPAARLLGASLLSCASLTGCGASTPPGRGSSPEQFPLHVTLLPASADSRTLNLHLSQTSCGPASKDDQRSGACGEVPVRSVPITLELADGTALTATTDKRGNATFDLADIEPNDKLAEDPQITIHAGPLSTTATLIRSSIYKNWKGSRTDASGGGSGTTRKQPPPQRRQQKSEGAHPRQRQAYDAQPHNPAQEQMQAALADLDAWSHKNIVLSVIASPSVATCTNRVEFTVPCDGAAAYNKKLTFVQYTRIANKSPRPLLCGLQDLVSTVISESPSGAVQVAKELAEGAQTIEVGQEANRLDVLPTSTEGQNRPMGGAVCYLNPEDLASIVGEAFAGNAALVFINNRSGTETYRYMINDRLIGAAADGTFQVLELEPIF